MSNAVKIQLVTAVAMAVAATPQYPTEMTGHAEGVAGYEVTFEDNSVTWVEETEYLASYQNFTDLTFAQAIALANQGHKIACKRWNTFFKHVPLGTTFPVLPPLEELGDGTLTEYPQFMLDAVSKAYFEITTEDGQTLINFRPDHHDLQCDMWYVWTQEAADAEYAEWVAAGEPTP